VTDGQASPASDRIGRIAANLREVLARQPHPTMVLFSAPAPDTAAADAREQAAVQIAEQAGLQPWPSWAPVRHGVGTGAHLLNTIDELGETGRAAGVVICPLAPIEPSLLAQAAAVAGDAGLELVVVADTEAS
jgi:hypothetical protein